jgi:hypothetical protein
MNTIETISIAVYPWAAPTQEQRAWFDALSPDEKRKAIQAAIDEGFKSRCPVSPSMTSSTRRARKADTCAIVLRRARNAISRIFIATQS